jgi:hypothetical protein
LLFLPRARAPVDVVLLDALEHLLDDLGLALAVLADEEEHPLDDHGQADGRQEQDGPHHEAAGGEQLHRRFVQKNYEGKAMGDHGWERAWSGFRGAVSGIIPSGQFLSESVLSKFGERLSAGTMPLCYLGFRR